MKNSVFTHEIAAVDGKTIQSFFDAIPKRYDLLNSVLSLSLDRWWRKIFLRTCLEEAPGGALLDIGTGTGASLVDFLKDGRFKKVVGCDFSKGMLNEAKRRTAGASLAAADMHQLPFRKASFDLVTSCFVLRSARSLELLLGEVKRVLKPGGKFVFLELTRPDSGLFWTLIYKPYLKFYIPLVGRVVSKHPNAYQFLSSSIQSFMKPKEFKDTLEQAGFSEIKIRSLSFGAATIFSGKASH